MRGAGNARWQRSCLQVRHVAAALCETVQVRAATDFDRKWTIGEHTSSLSSVLHICRITPKGCPAVEAATASGAWNALYSADSVPSVGRSKAAMPVATQSRGSSANDGGSAAVPAVQARPGGGMSGARAFGLGNPR